MAERWAVATGNWSATGTWNDGTLPGAGDDVHANGYTVTINQDVTVASLRTTAGSTPVAGGGFSMSTAYTINGNLIAGTTACLTNNAASGTAVVNGNCTGGSGSSAYGANNATTGTLAITGNCLAGSGASATGAINAVGGALNITGNCTGGSGASAFGANNATTGTLNITGNCTGGSNSNCHGAVNITTGVANITGNCTGGSHSSAYGAQNTAGGTLNVYGEACGTVANTGTAGVINQSNGACYVQVAVGNNAPNNGITAGAYGAVQNSIAGSITVDAAISGSGGWPGFLGRTFVRNAGTNYVTMRESNAGATLSMGELAADFPAASNVRSGVSYDAGNRVGTCAVPPAGSVAFGVAVDNTTGTAALSPTALLGADLKTRLEACATVQTVGDQLAALGV